ncbi:hypothetical protein Dimus_027774 [Dionaea muscipula]
MRKKIPEIPMHTSDHLGIDLVDFYIYIYKQHFHILKTESRQRLACTKNSNSIRFKKSEGEIDGREKIESDFVGGPSDGNACRRIISKFLQTSQVLLQLCHSFSRYDSANGVHCSLH